MTNQDAHMSNVISDSLDSIGIPMEVREDLMKDLARVTVKHLINIEAHTVEDLSKVVDIEYLGSRTLEGLIEDQ